MTTIAHAVIGQLFSESVGSEMLLIKSALPGLDFNGAQHKHTRWREANKHPSFLEVFEQAPMAVFQSVHVSQTAPPKALPFCFLHNQTRPPPPTTPSQSHPNPDIPFLQPPPSPPLCFLAAHKQILEVCPL